MQLKIYVFGEDTIFTLWASKSDYLDKVTMIERMGFRDATDEKLVFYPSHSIRKIEVEQDAVAEEDTVAEKSVTEKSMDALVGLITRQVATRV